MSEEKILEIINTAEEYALKYGLMEEGRPQNYKHDTMGMDIPGCTVYINNTSQIYTLKQDEFEIILTDKKSKFTGYEYGTPTSCKERDMRELLIKLEKKKLIRAQKVLGGMSTKKDGREMEIKPTGWNVQKVYNLEQVIENLEKIKEQKNLED